MIEFDELGRVDLIGVFPGVVAFGVIFPFDEVLESSSPAVTSMTLDLIHFIFFFPINQIRRRSGEVWAVREGFAIGR